MPGAPSPSAPSSSDFPNQQRRKSQAFGIATSIQTDKTAEALAEIDKEVRALQRDKPVTREELALLTKGQVLALPGQFETNQAMVSYLQHVNRFGRPYHYITTLPDRYAALQPASLTAAASSALQPDKLSWVVVGDLAKIEASVRKLGWSVEVWDSQGRLLRK